MEKINTRKGTQLTVQCSKCYDNFYFFCHRSIDSSIDFYFLPCWEKAHDNSEFCRENLKPRRESRITTH